MTIAGLLSVHALRKSFGTREVLSGVGFDVRPGEFVTVLGSSGAGKTTLIRCIAGIERADSGEVRFATPGGTRAGVDPDQIGLIFQDLNLIRRLSALDNVVAAIANELGPLELALRWYRRAIVERAAGALATVGLAEHATLRADRLSGGQQQRVAIARTLVKRSRLVLADEPVASLDGHTAREVLSALKKATRETGCAVLCSLHQVDLALEFSDRLLGMSAGTIWFDRTPLAVDAAALQDLYRPAARSRAAAPA